MIAVAEMVKRLQQVPQHMVHGGPPVDGVHLPLSGESRVQIAGVLLTPSATGAHTSAPLAERFPGNLEQVRRFVYIHSSALDPMGGQILDHGATR